ncbi:MAG: PLD nuclease N-terminal domain-containing protein [Desulfoplanes sp.]
MPALSPDKIALLLVLLILPVIPNLWSIWHIFRHGFATPAEKQGWIWLNIMLPVLGGIIYFFVGRRRAVDPQIPAPPADEDK